jgi:hypothetical protein
MELRAMRISNKGEAGFADETILNAIDQATNPQTASISSILYGREWNSLRLFFVLGCLFSIPPLVNSLLHTYENKDYSHWYVIGSSVLAGEPLYTDAINGEPGYMYPPTAAVLFYGPLSCLNHFCFVSVLCLTTTVAWMFSVWASTVLTTGGWKGNSWRSTILPGLAVAPYVWDIQFLGQTNVLLLALTLGALLSLRNYSPISAGSLFGMAVALKAFPLPAIAYFIVRRSWFAVVASVISVFAFVWFFPGIIRGFERNTMELKQWASLMILDQSGESMAGRSSIGYTRRNQSLVSVSHRLLRPVNAGDNPKKPLYVNFAEVSPQTAQLIGHGTCFLLGLVLLLACRFRFAPSGLCEGIEIAMVCTLVPLCSPLAWTYFFCWLLPGWTALGYWWSHPSLAPVVRRNVKIGIGISATLLASAISEQIDPTLQACGMTAWGAVMMFLTLAYVRFHLPNQTANLDAETKTGDIHLSPV